MFHFKIVFLRLQNTILVKAYNFIFLTKIVCDSM